MIERIFENLASRVGWIFSPTVWKDYRPTKRREKEILPSQKLISTAKRLNSSKSAKDVPPFVSAV